MEGAPRLLDHLSPAAQAHRESVLAALDRLGIAYEEDSTLVRGFDYYTMTVFEFTSDHLGAQSAVGGGGRYDGLVEALGGPPTPGIGFGAGHRAHRAGPGVGRARARAAPRLLRGRARRRPAPGADARWSSACAPRGLRCESELRGRSLKAMMRHASSLGARYAVIVGAREHARRGRHGARHGQRRAAPGAPGRPGGGAERMIGASRYRSHGCAEVADALGERVRVSGWVHRRRDHGGVVFIDLRDRSGIVQLVFHPTDAPAGERDGGLAEPGGRHLRGGRGGGPLAADGQPGDPDRRGGGERRAPRDPVRGRPAAVLGRGRVAGGLRGAAAHLPLPRHPPAAPPAGAGDAQPGGVGDAPGAGGRRLPRGRDARC